MKVAALFLFAAMLLPHPSSAADPGTVEPEFSEDAIASIEDRIVDRIVERVVARLEERDVVEKIAAKVDADDFDVGRVGQYATGLTDHARNGYLVVPDPDTGIPVATSSIWVSKHGGRVKECLWYRDHETGRGHNVVQGATYIAGRSDTAAAAAAQIRQQMLAVPALVNPQPAVGAIGTPRFGAQP